MDIIIHFIISFDLYTFIGENNGQEIALQYLLRMLVKRLQPTIAQLVERRTVELRGYPQVAGSIPAGRSFYHPTLFLALLKDKEGQVCEYQLDHFFSLRSSLMRVTSWKAGRENFFLVDLLFSSSPEDSSRLQRSLAQAFSSCSLQPTIDVISSFQEDSLFLIFLMRQITAEAMRLGAQLRNLGCRRASSSTYWARCWFLASSPITLQSGSKNLQDEFMISSKLSSLMMSAYFSVIWAAVYWLAQQATSCLTCGTWQVSSNLAAMQRAATPTSCSSPSGTSFTARYWSISEVIVNSVSGNILYLQWSSLSQSMSLARDCSETVLCEGMQSVSLQHCFSRLFRKCMFSEKYSGTIWGSLISSLISTGLTSACVLLLRRAVMLECLGLRERSRRRSPCRKEQLRLYLLWSWSARLVTSFPKMRLSMCLLDKLIIIVVCDKFNMRYNELTYHKASPFYKQDYLPDRAWLNRKPKDFPSEIPTGQDYFADSGRKHFAGHFNHSEIASKSILESPERYPFENRIALDKTYGRNLDTIDIEGAASGTRMNQSIKNKLKAQQELARRYNQSLDMRQHKEKTYDEKRREIAQKQFDTLQERRTSQNEAALASSRASQNNEPYRPQEDTNPETYQPYYVDSNNYGKKYITLLPKPYYAHLEPKNQNQHDPRQRNDSNKQPERVPQENYERREQYYPPQQYNESEAQLKKQQTSANKQLEEQQQYAPLSMNNRHKSNPEYNNAYDAEWNRKRQEYLKNVEMEQVSRNKLQDKREFRKYNPTNLSFNLAAQSIVGNNH